MPLIDHTYFIGELNIPNTDRPDVQENLLVFIKKYEKEFLLDILGYEVHRDFIAGLEVDPMDAKWIQLRDGAEYTDRYDRLTRWPGLRSSEDKTSIITNYVYFHYMRDSMSQTVGIGEAVSKAENATIVSPRFKMINAWNDMVTGLLGFRSYLDNTDTIYSGWSSFYSNRLYQKYRYINEFGI